jgi:carbonic anhydrase
LVAVPLSLGIALASGAPIMAGLIAAAVGGIVVGFCGGAPLQVSGPAAGLTVLVYGVVQQFDWRVVCLVTVLAGLLQLVFGVLKVARIALAITPAVVHGMLAGIGVTIALAQLHVVLGGSPESHALENLKSLPAQIMDLNHPSVILGISTIAILLAWQYVPKKVKALPGALVAVTATTAASVLFNMDVKRVDLPENLLNAFALPVFPEMSLWGAVLVSAATIAVVASVESLLSAVATDRLHNHERADLDRELVGQGIGNMVSGAIGGLPITGVIVRSSANINSGASSRLSAILHGVWIVVFVAILGSVIQLIPLSALAGLLVFVGVRLVSMEHIRDLMKHRELPVYLITVLGVVGKDLLVGVGIGLALSMILLIRRLTRLELTVREQDGDWHVDIGGSMTFVNVPRLAAELARIPSGSRVHVEMHTDMMDHAAFEALHGWEQNHLKTGGDVVIDELHDDWYHRAVHDQPKAHRTPIRHKKELASTATGE